jgi:hypothetical protein
MSDNSVIEFCSHQDDDPFEIVLKPVSFKVLPGNSLRFVATNCETDFVWVLRFIQKAGAIQLFADSNGDYNIEVYENDMLLTEELIYMNGNSFNTL